MGTRTTAKNKTNNTRSDGSLLQYFRSTFSRGGGARSGFYASGGTIVESGGYRYHVFLEPGFFEFSTVQEDRYSNFTIDMLIIAGGGGGGGGGTAPNCGGGGAGGVREITELIGRSRGKYPVIVGSGGSGATTPVDPTGTRPGVNGNNSSVTTTIPYVSTGGGTQGEPGGSGGGGRIPRGEGNVPPTTPAQGYPGGNGATLGPNPGIRAGGGGGAGGAGTDAVAGPPSIPGVAGPGREMPNWPAPIIGPAIPAPFRPSWTPAVGPTGFYGGGGAASAGIGGVGGGGDGSTPTLVGKAGVNYTGGGGGGASSGQPGSPGGTGIVIIRYSI